MNFILRPWSLEDLNSLVQYANNPNIAKFLTNSFPYPYTEENGKAFIEFANKDKPIRIFAIDVNGVAVGGIGIHPQSDIQCKNAELGYWLGEPYWGKGIMSAAIKQAVDFAFQNYDIDRVFARPFGTNISSQRVLEKNNFSFEGKFENTLFKNGEYLDELFYSIRRGQWSQ
jgi:RimJ/RimL family protein N-acetyltransferase